MKITINFYWIFIALAISFSLSSCQKNDDSINLNQLKKNIPQINNQSNDLNDGFNLKIITFNVLAPCWASPDYYPTSSISRLDKVYRRNKIVSFLKEAVASNASVIALQEVQQDEFQYYLAAVNSNSNTFEGFMSLHNDNYWSSWITADPPFVSNGNALFLKKDVFNNIQFFDKPLTDDGNHCVFATASDKFTNHHFRIASIHLDSDHSNRRRNELNALLSGLDNETNTIDIIAGDFNATLTAGNLNYLMRKYNFMNSLDEAGIAEQTHPFTNSYNRNVVWGPIDHITYRNTTLGGKIESSNNGLPNIDYGVVDFDVWKLYPSGLKFESDRINKNFDNCGSDHFPVISTLHIQ